MKKEERKESELSKKIIILIIILIALLFFVTSCSFTSHFLGKLGASLSDSIDNLFKNEDDIKIEDTPSLETIRNQQLKFDTDTLSISLKDENAKIGFSYQKIRPNAFTCSTDDASIATCYVVDDYVVVRPKAPGKVKVILQAKVNGKIYEAVSTVTVLDHKRGISLSSSSGMLNLKESQKRYLFYYLNDIEGDIQITSSNPKVATAKVTGKRTIEVTAKKVGNTTITVSITYQGVTYQDSYHLNVVNMDLSVEDPIPNKPANEKPAEEGNIPEEKPSIPENPSIPSNPEEEPYVTDIVVSTPYALDQTFSSTTFEYSILVQQEHALSIDIMKSSSVKKVLYQLNGKAISHLHALPLEQGWNFVEIIVSNASGKNNTYTLSIYQETEEFYFQSDASLYSIAVDRHHTGEKTIIVNTNLMEDGEVSAKVSANQKEINLCAEDRCIRAWVDAVQDDALAILSYEQEKENTNHFPFKVNVNGLGKSIIHFSASYLEEEVGSFDVAVTSVEKHRVTLKANGGMFESLEEEYEFFLAEDEIFDLSDVDEPYRIDEKSCLIYHFKGYSKESDGELVFDKKDKGSEKYIIKELTDDVTFYAIYEVEGEDIEDEEVKKTVWLSDASIFYNREIDQEEYFKNRGEVKVISPGTAGSYQMHFQNDTSFPIKITGMILKENTVCIPLKGCLNMGYIIKHSKPEEDTWKYYYGEPNDQYWILNKRKASASSITDYRHQFTEEIRFPKEISVAKGEEITISLFWKWIDQDNKLDTAIGNYVAQKNVDGTIQDTYQLSIGLHYQTKITCDK